MELPRDEAKAAKMS